METAKTYKTAVNFFSSLLFQVVSTVVGFIVPQIILRTYGTGIFGFSTSVTQFAICINTLETGIGAGFIQALYKPLHQNSNDKINRLLSRAKSFYIKTGGIIITVCFFISFIYTIAASDEISFTSLLPLSMVILMGAAAEYIFIGRYRVLLTADEKVCVLINIQTAALLLSSIIRITMMLLGFSVVLMQVSATLIYVLRVLVIKAYIKKRYPYTNYSFKKIDDTKIDNNAVLVHNISNMAVVNVPFLLLYTFGDLGKVSVYAVYALVFNALYSILSNVFMLSAVASFGKTAAADSHQILKDNYDTFEFVFIAILSGFYLAAILLMLPFASLYTKGTSGVNYLDPTLLTLLSLYGIVYTLRVPALTIIFATGYFKETFKGASVETVLAFTAPVICYIIFGFYGIFGGLIISAIYRIIDLFVFCNKKILCIKPYRLYKRVIINALFIGVFVPLIKYVYYITYNSWINFIIVGAFIGLFVILLSLIVNLIFQRDKTRVLFDIIGKIIK